MDNTIPESAPDELRHITISGDLGSGKSSVAGLVAAALNREVVSTGAIQRQIASELQLSTLETNILAEQDRNIDTKIDGVTKELGRTSTEPLVFDSRMAWHILDQAFKVRLVVDPEVAVQRVVGRGATAAEEYDHAEHARKEVRQRFESEVRRFIARYGVDITAPENFDLVVDTSDLDPHAVAELIVAAFLAHSAPAIYVSPKRVIPGMYSESKVTAAGDDITVVYRQPFMFALSGFDALERALTSGESVIKASLNSTAGTDAARLVQDATMMNRWEAEFGLDYTSVERWGLTAD